MAKCKKCGGPILVKKKPKSPTISSHTEEARKDIPDKNPLSTFESYLKDIHKLIFHAKESEDPIPRIRNNFEEMLKSYQVVRKDISGKDKTIKDMEALIEVGKAVNSVLYMNQLLNIIMDFVIKVVSAERGFLMLKDKETGELVFQLARNMDEEIKDKSFYTISSGIISRVARNGEPILTTDAQSDERFSDQKSVMDHHLRSVMCVPLKIKEEVIGTIFVDNRVIAGAFTDSSLKLLSSFANQAAIAIENARLYEKRCRRNKEATKSSTISICRNRRQYNKQE